MINRNDSINSLLLKMFTNIGIKLPQVIDSYLWFSNIPIFIMAIFECFLFLICLLRNHNTSRLHYKTRWLFGNQNILDLHKYCIVSEVIFHLLMLIGSINQLDYWGFLLLYLIFLPLKTLLHYCAKDTTKH